MEGEEGKGREKKKDNEEVERAREKTNETEDGFRIVVWGWGEAEEEAGRLRKEEEKIEKGARRIETLGDVRHAGEALISLSTIRSLRLPLPSVLSREISSRFTIASSDRLWR